MKTFIKAFILIAALLCFYSCSHNKEEVKEYYVTYRVYYTSTDIKTETYRTNLAGRYDIHLDSYRGSNSISITRHNSLTLEAMVLSTTAPIEIIDYSSNFTKAYGINSKL